MVGEDWNRPEDDLPVKSMEVVNAAEVAMPVI